MAMGAKLVIDLSNANRWYIEEVKEQLTLMGLKVKEIEKHWELK